MKPLLIPKSSSSSSGHCCEGCCWIYVVYVCVSWLLFTFLSIESTGHCPEIPTCHAPPLPKPKPKPKKAPLPPKNAIAASTTSTSHKGNEAPHAKKKGKAPAKQPPLPPPKAAGASATREAGEYCPGRAAPVGACAWGCLAWWRVPWYVAVVLKSMPGMFVESSLLGSGSAGHKHPRQHTDPLAV